MRKLKWRLRGTNVTSLSHQTLSAPTQENIYSSKPQTEVQSRNCSTPWQHVKVGEREKRNDRIRTYRSCIQHKNLEIVRNPEVAFWSWFDTIISFKTPPKLFHSRSFEVNWQQTYKGQVFNVAWMPGTFTYGKVRLYSGIPLLFCQGLIGTQKALSLLLPPEGATTTRYFTGSPVSAPVTYTSANRASDPILYRLSPGHTRMCSWKMARSRIRKLTIYPVPWKIPWSSTASHPGLTEALHSDIPVFT